MCYQWSMAHIFQCNLFQQSHMLAYCQIYNPESSKIPTGSTKHVSLDWHFVIFWQSHQNSLLQHVCSSDLCCYTKKKFFFVNVILLSLLYFNCFKKYLTFYVLKLHLIFIFSQWSSSFLQPWHRTHLCIFSLCDFIYTELAHMNTTNV